MTHAAANKIEHSLSNDSSYEQGLIELRELISLSRTTKESLHLAQQELEAIPEPEVQQMISLGLQQLKERLDLTKVENNFRHVEEQLLRPVIEDAKELHAVFGVNPVRLRLLVVLHDLGKVEIPTNLWTVLNHKFPNDFVGREILTHEFASMHWIQLLGDQLGMSPKTIWALQSLIANHNFGPNLCDPRHKHLLNNWWPYQFRTRIIPMLRELKFDLSALYDKSPDGEFQYNHCEDNVYAAILAVYDRAIATKFNSYGVATWQKFAEQDYNAWLSLKEKDPNVLHPLRASHLTQKMEHAAIWAESEIEAMWRILAEKHVPKSLLGQFSLETFSPYVKQRDGVRKLLRAIKQVKESNPSDSTGRLLFKTEKGEVYRIEDASQSAFEQKAKLLYWEASQQQWQLIAEDQSPIRLYFEMIRGDL